MRMLFSMLGLPRLTPPIALGSLACLLLLMHSSLCSQSFDHAGPPLKPRVIILTDPREAHEADDGQSLVRLLAFADLVEIEALIATTGWNWWSSSHINAGFAELQSKVAAYEEDVGNLMKRSGQTGFADDERQQSLGYWPSPEYLAARTARGMARDYMSRVGNGNDTAGSRLIIEVIDEDDPRPVWVLVWGGPNVLAQAVWDVAHNPASARSPEEVAAFIAKMRVVAITEQDTNFFYYTGREEGDYVSNNSAVWLRSNYPDLFWVRMEKNYPLWSGPSDDFKAHWKQFYTAHVQGRGALGAAYPTHTFGIEGDTPALHYVLPLGLSDPAQPDMGGWGGVFRFGQTPKEQDTTSSWTDWHVAYPDLPDMNASSLDRWIEQMWTEFAARMDWAAEGEGNRNPVAVLRAAPGSSPVTLYPAPGETLVLDATASYDPDGDALSFTWEVYPHASGSVPPVALHDAATPMASVVLPAAPGALVDLVLTVRDNGDPWSLVAYQRVRLVTDAAHASTVAPWSLATLPPGEQRGFVRDWMGRLWWNAETFPWVWHADHGWLFFAAGARPDGLWFHDAELGWCWTARGLYPTFYRAATDAWNRYEEGTRDPRVIHIYP